MRGGAVRAKLQQNPRDLLDPIVIQTTRETPQYQAPMQYMTTGSCVHGMMSSVSSVLIEFSKDDADCSERNFHRVDANFKFARAEVATESCGFVRGNKKHLRLIHHHAILCHHHFGLLVGSASYFRICWPHSGSCTP